jgi:hypothetical protein
MEPHMTEPLTPKLGTDQRDPGSVRRRLDRMEHLLEGLVRIPGTSKRVGLDVMLDVLPVGGSVIGAGMGAWLAWEARNLGVSKWTLAKMAGNIGVDFVLGSIPVIGIIPDYFFKSNTRNMRLIRRWLDEHHPELAAESDGGDHWEPRVNRR